METCTLYWIRHPEHTDITTQGYVGISVDFERRMKQHKRNEDTIPMLVKAKRKYGWDNLINSIVLIGSQEYCKLIESKLRPTPYIGWNNAQGGGGVLKGNTPWNKGKKMSDEQMVNHKPFTGKHTVNTKQVMSANNTGAKNPRARNIILVHPDGTKELHFGTVRQRCIELGIDYKKVYTVAKGQRKSFSGGYKAYYPTTDEINDLI